MEKCFDVRKFQPLRQGDQYPWGKFVKHIPTRSGQQIKDKVRNLHFSWTRAQEKARQEAADRGEKFEEVEFENLDLYKGELEEVQGEKEVVQPSKVVSSVNKRKFLRLEQEASKAGCKSCYIWIKKL